MKSLYETLEVSPRVGNFVIRAAYRCLAQHDHPDKNPDSEDAGQWMSNINRAYAVLSDLKKRQEYDRGQGINQDFCERRGLRTIFTAHIKSGDKATVTVRPFAFRPLS